MSFFADFFPPLIGGLKTTYHQVCGHLLAMLFAEVQAVANQLTDLPWSSGPRAGGDNCGIDSASDAAPADSNCCFSSWADAYSSAATWRSGQGVRSVTDGIAASAGVGSHTKRSCEMNVLK